ncbi:uncharacterized protein LOC17894228 [Capsella rubella]|uniref:uncharacterized protein LOC17894228 n=1 Tax=Capsella rubella TaxID=81985 RepID=UPI000CD5A7F3|nr:uncharacterized protein LOC17894228 [Capsella rubella]
MNLTPSKLPIHNHPLFPSSRYVYHHCNGCHVYKENINGGYYCNEPGCYAKFHKECGEAPLEINHSSHPQHPLLLTNDSGESESPCHLCGKNLLPSYYSCLTCQYKVDLICGMKPSPPIVEYPMSHEHPLVFLKKQEENILCELCKESIGGPSYSCLGCNVYFHADCLNLSKEVNHPCHSSHPLKLIASDTLAVDAEKSCLICQEPKVVLYHCSLCNFTSCIRCIKNPPPLVIEHTKTHKHPLTLVLKRISYLCDVCGHRGIGYSKCGVCHRSINQYKGAYSCSICPNYAVHFICAFIEWDGKNYEGTTNEIIENIAPYKVVGDNLISHFSHEKHLLKLHKEILIHNDHIRCEACCYSLGFSYFYVCEECWFFLHEKCANLPMKKKMVFDVVPYTLKAVRKTSYCTICSMVCDGFKYTAQGRLDIDVRCGSLYEPFVHKSHIHPLYIKLVTGNCIGCGNVIDNYALICIICENGLCLSCANLPEYIWHKNDVHPLTLCFGCEMTSSNYCCDICEEELDPSKWFYSCFDCGVTLHTQCVIGNFSGLLLGRRANELEVVLNNHNTRPLCSQCHSRCNPLIILKLLHNRVQPAIHSAKFAK